MPLDLLKSEKGRDVLVLEGYMYIRNAIQNGRIYWECIEKRQHRCYGRAISEGESAFNSRLHNHPANPSKIELKRIVQQCREQALVSQSRPSTILANVISAASPSARFQVSKTNLTKTILRARRKLSLGSLTNGQHRYSPSPKELIGFFRNTTDDNILDVPSCAAGESSDECTDITCDLNTIIGRSSPAGDLPGRSLDDACDMESGGCEVSSVSVRDANGAEDPTSSALKFSPSLNAQNLGLCCSCNADLHGDLASAVTPTSSTAPSTFGASLKQEPTVIDSQVVKNNAIRNDDTRANVRSDCEASCSTLMEEDGFVFYDSGSFGERVIGFSSRRSLTFLRCPQIGVRLYDLQLSHLAQSAFLMVVYARLNGFYLPCAWVLIVSNSEMFFTEVFEALKKTSVQLNPSEIFTDPNVPLIAACKRCFAGSVVRVAFDALCDDFARRLVSNRLWHRCKGDGDLSLKLRMLIAFAFVPVSNLVDAFGQFADTIDFPSEVLPVLDFFEDAYIGRPNHHGQRRVPAYPLEMWNLSSILSASNFSSLYPFEKWPQVDKGKFANRKASVTSLVEGFKRECVATLVSFPQLVADAAAFVPVDQRNRSLLVLTSQFKEFYLLQYLRKVAQCISLRDLL